jgi:hypothetical protein
MSGKSSDFEARSHLDHMNKLPGSLGAGPPNGPLQCLLARAPPGGKHSID